MRAQEVPTLVARVPRRVRAAVACAAAAVHLAVLYSPRAPSVGSEVRLDLLVHVAVFAAVATTARWAGVGSRTVGLVLAVEALVSEGVQALWLPGRTGDVTDLLADAVGTVVGLWAAAALARRRPASSRARP